MNAQCYDRTDMLLRWRLVGAESAASSQPGATPQDSRLRDGEALKARLNALMNRAFSAEGLYLWCTWGGAPGYHEHAPLALRAYLRFPDGRARHTYRA
jgi:hypothetical protein